MDAGKVLLVPTLGRQHLQAHVSLKPRSQRCCAPIGTSSSGPADACPLGSKWAHSKHKTDATSPVESSFWWCLLAGPTRPHNKRSSTAEAAVTAPAGPNYARRRAKHTEATTPDSPCAPTGDVRPHLIQLCQPHLHSLLHHAELLLKLSQAARPAQGCPNSTTRSGETGGRGSTPGWALLFQPSALPAPPHWAAAQAAGWALCTDAVLAVAAVNTSVAAQHGVGLYLLTQTWQEDHLRNLIKRQSNTSCLKQ